MDCLPIGRCKPEGVLNHEVPGLRQYNMKQSKLECHVGTVDDIAEALSLTGAQQPTMMRGISGS